MRIVAIGGGEIGRPGTQIETEVIDKEIIKLTGKKHPQVLFLPTASVDSTLYADTIKGYYGKRLGCNVDTLYLYNNKSSFNDIKSKILNADIIYVGGGNTLRMLKLWRKLGVDKVIREAMKKDIVLSGVSAGAICWFKYANSDSLKFSDDRNPLIKIKGLDFVPVMACPHYDFEKTRRPSLNKMIQKYGGISIALDNCSAIEIIDDKYRIITSSKNANAYKVYRQNGKVIEQKLPKDAYRSIDELLKV